MNADSAAATTTAARRRRHDTLPATATTGAWLLPGPAATAAAALLADLAFWPVLLAAILVTATVLACFHQRGERAAFGLANGVTLVRVNLTIFLLAAAWAGYGLAPAGSRFAWSVFVVALVALLLDGIDGWLARLRREASRFGEQFDMGADTVLTLTLTLCLWAFGLAGAWVFLIGLMRPFFVALGHWRPRLRAPLSPSRLRKVLCALALSLLVAGLAPPLASFASLLAVLALLTLATSFGRDLWQLERQVGT